MTLNKPITYPKIAVAQLNLPVGAIDSNVQQLLHAIEHAASQDVDIVLTPELAVCGYPPEDLLFRAAFASQCEQAFKTLLKASSNYPQLHIVLGHPAWKPNDNGAIDCFNAASILCNGVCLASYYKQELPNYGVFDEKRYFKQGKDTFTFTVKGSCFGVAICEDVWFDTVPKALKLAGADTVLVLNASPFHRGKLSQRMAVAKHTVCALGMSYVGVNHVGGQDELVFDGASFALNAQGQCVSIAPQFEAVFHVIENLPGLAVIGNDVLNHDMSEATIYQALVLATRDYVHKNGFKGALLGLSGGVDSALVLAIACDAIGVQAVRAVMMPTRYTASMSLVDSRDMVARLGVEYEELVIEGLYQQYLDTLAADFAGTAAGVAEENLQARIRGTLLMALSNKFGSIVLTTGNKSETAVGYCTLYGDMAGGFAVLKDIPKTLVYRLCAWRNQHGIELGQGEVIPQNILTRAPSAELRENQTDQDSLPAYEVLDAIVDAHLERDLSFSEIVALGFEAADVQRVLRLIQVNEYKRRQAAVGPKITTRAFGRDWRMPITNAWRDVAK